MLGRLSDVSDVSGGGRTLVTELRTGFGRFRTLVYADLPCMQSILPSSKKIERLQRFTKYFKSCHPRGGWLVFHFPCIQQAGFFQKLNKKTTLSFKKPFLKNKKSLLRLQTVHTRSARPIPDHTRPHLDIPDHTRPYPGSVTIPDHTRAA